MTWFDTWRQWIGSTLTPPYELPSFSAAALPGNLRRLRIERGLTVTQLAERAKVSGSTVRDIEANDKGFGDIKPNPTLVTLLALAKALGVEISALVREDMK